LIGACPKRRARYDDAIGDTDNDFKVEHRPGHSHGNADAISRIPDGVTPEDWNISGDEGMDNNSGDSVTRDGKVTVRRVMDAKRNATTDRDRYLSVRDMVSLSNTSRGIIGTTHETSVLDVEGRNWTEPDDIIYDCNTVYNDYETTNTDSVTRNGVIPVYNAYKTKNDDSSTEDAGILCMKVGAILMLTRYSVGR